MSEIIDTGLRGYLKWLRRDQPAIYMKVAPVLAAKVPEAFSDREQSNAMGVLMGLGDDAESGASGASTDVADAANTGAASPSIGAIIGNLVTAAGQIYLTKTQVDALGKVNDMQLQRVAAGLNPLDVSSLNFGVPTVNVGVAPKTGTLLFGLLLVGGALWLLGSRHRSA